MSLEVLLALVVGGIAGIAVLLHVMGLTAPHVFKNGREAMAAWAREVPEHPATGFHLSSDFHAALVTFDGGYGIVWSFGSDTVARVLGNSRANKTKTGLQFDFPDFGASKLDVALTEKDREVWINLLEAQ